MMAKIGDNYEFVNYDHEFVAELRNDHIELNITCPLNDDCHDIDIDRGGYFFVEIVCPACANRISIENPFPEPNE